MNPKLIFLLLSLILTIFFFGQQQQQTIEQVEILEQDGGYTDVGKTTRYWDCCKSSCSWPSNVPGNYNPVRTCNAKGGTVDPNTKNVCAGGGNPGPAYVCADQQPWTDGGIFYAFVASNKDCCGCYEFQFTSGPVSGKTMRVQVINKGGDLSQNHFDIQVPGGGFGIYNGCAANGGEPANPPAMYPSTPYSNWGQRYGGIGTRGDCAKLPGELQRGCYWRFDDFKNADNPPVNFKQIACPSQLTSKSGCKPK